MIRRIEYDNARGAAKPTRTASCQRDQNEHFDIVMCEISASCSVAMREFRRESLDSAMRLAMTFVDLNQRMPAS